jgi:hypothetical protein
MHAETFSRMCCPGCGRCPRCAGRRSSRSHRCPRRLRLRRRLPLGGIKSQNIFEVKPDASADPATPSRPTASAPRCSPATTRPCGGRWGGRHRLQQPARQAPEAGNLIQPFVQYPGSAPDQRGRGLAPGAQQLDHSLWRRAAAHRDGCCCPCIFYWHQGPIWGMAHPTGPQDRALHPVRARGPLGQCHRLSCILAVFGHRHGVWQVLHPAGHGARCLAG